MLGEEKKRRISHCRSFLDFPQKPKNGEQYVCQLCHQGKVRKIVDQQENELWKICMYKTVAGGGGEKGIAFRSRLVQL